MDLLEKLLNKLGYLSFRQIQEKESRIADIVSGEPGQLLTEGKPIPQNYDAYLQSYLTHVWVYACTYLISNSIAGLNFKIVKKKVDKQNNVELVDVTNQVEAAKILNNPNENDENSTYYNLMEFTQSSLELTGNSYWLLDDFRMKRNGKSSRSVKVPQGKDVNFTKEVIEDIRKQAEDQLFEKGQPRQIQPLIASRVQVIPGRNKLIVGYVYKRQDGKNEFFSEQEILHFKSINPSDYYYGVGSVSAAELSSSTHQEALWSNWHTFKNGAKMDGVLSTEQQLNEKIWQRLFTQFRNKYIGTKNSHKIAVLEKGLKFQSTTQNNRDLEFNEGMKMLREQICAAFAVPPMMVGILDKSTYSNYQEAQKIFWKNCVIPKLQKLEDVINTFIHIYDPEAFFQFDIANIDALREDQKVMSETVKNYWSIGVPMNQLIDAFSLPFDKTDEGDTGYIPISFIPVGTSRQATSNSNNSDDDKSKSVEKVKKVYTEEQKNHLWKQFDEVNAKIESRYIIAIAKFFAMLEREALRRLRDIKEVIDEENLKAPHNKVSELDIDVIILNEGDIVQRWADESSKFHKVALNTAGSITMRNMGLDVSFDQDTASVQRFLREFGLENSTEVIGTHRKELATALAESIAAGESSIPQLSKKIREVYRPYRQDGWKAERIARTEVIGASNQGANEAYDQSGVVIGKVWLSTRDSRVRDAHRDADGQRRALNEPFDVGGEQLMHPHDPNGSAGNVINCRCTTLPILEGEDV